MRVGIIGFGFSGLMVTANLVRAAHAPCIIYVIAEDLRGLGVAYATTNADHLLNVVAGKMGAFADDLGGFHRWLSTADGALALQALHLTARYQENDFVPRALYGAYLQTIWRDTQALAAEKQIELKLVPTDAVAVTPGATLAILTARGDAIAVDRAVLASGHEIKPILPTVVSDAILQNPWAGDAFAGAAAWGAPVLLMGTGLTMIDTLMMLRAGGYAGAVIAFSRHGLLPQRHAPQASVFRFAKEQLLLQKNLQHYVGLMRRTIRAHGDWRAVVDALRPHTTLLWQRLTTPDQKRFLERLGAYWSVHRHRMAPDIAARVDAEIASGALRIIASKKLVAEQRDGQLHIALTDHHQLQHNFTPARLINCTGPELNVEKSMRPLIRQVVAQGLVEPHATGIGIAADLHGRAWGTAFPQLYAVGALLTGQLLESTAVPELRAQAVAVANHIVASA
ncbi:MAG: FAD/NAD(P)-binding protein [Pseudomonadota bacterium]